MPNNDNGEQYQESYDPYGEPESFSQAPVWESEEALEGRGPTGYEWVRRAGPETQIGESISRTVTPKTLAKEAGRWAIEVPGKKIGRKAPRIVRPITGPGKWLGERQKLGPRGKPLEGPTRAERYIGKAWKAAKELGPGISKETKDVLYFGRVRPGFYTGMGPAAQAIAPGMSPAGQLHHMDLSGLRELTMPRGLTVVQQDVLTEVHKNGDYDTKSSVTQDMVSLGHGRGEAEKAFNFLVKKGIIKHGGEIINGEPVYEVNSQLLRK